MKKIKYVGGLGDTAEIVFKGSRTYRFQLDQELLVDDTAAEQLIETDNFVEVKDEVEPAKKKAVKGDK